MQPSTTLRSSSFVVVGSWASRLSVCVWLRKCKQEVVDGETPYFGDASCDRGELIVVADIITNLWLSLGAGGSTTISAESSIPKNSTMSRVSLPNITLPFHDYVCSRIIQPHLTRTLPALYHTLPHSYHRQTCSFVLITC